MTSKLRAFVGVLTVVLFLTVGATFLASERWVVGGVLTGLGLLRGWMWIRHVRAIRSSDEDPPPQG